MIRPRVNTQFAVGSNQGTGVPNTPMALDGMGNTSMPTPPSTAVDNAYLTNGALGANNAASSTANSGSVIGNALAQLYQTQPPAPSPQVENPTLSGGQFPPGAPTVSGFPGQHNIGPSLMNSNGEATADAIQRLDYLNGLPLMPSGIQGAAVNGPPTMAEGPAQPGGMMGLGAIMQQLSLPGQNNPRAQAMRSAPQPPLNLSLTFPQSNLGGGLR